MFIKKYDLIFSIGEACSSTSAIRKRCLQEFFYPFDWLFGGDIKERPEILNNDFKDFINKEDLEYYSEVRNINCTAYYNKKNNIIFNHDFLKDLSFDEGYKQAKEKYDRRINRLLKKIEKADSILLVYIETPTMGHKVFDNSYIIQCFEPIKNKYKDKKIDLLYVQNKKGSKLVVEKLTDNITKYTLDYKKDNKEVDYEVKHSALKACFRGVLLSNISFMIKTKTIRILLNFVPSKKLRQKITSKIKKSGG